MREAKRDGVPTNYILRVIQFAKQGYTDIEFDTYDTDWDSEAYLTVSGQNTNNSVRVTDDFLNAVDDDKDWNLTARNDGKVAKTLKARDLWEQIGLRRLGLRRSRHPVRHHHQRMAHLPGGPINATNPCSEYMFLDDTACNLASLNLCASPEDKPSTSKPTSTPAASGPWCSKSRC